MKSITLTIGNVPCEIIGVFNYLDKEYMALYTLDGHEDIYLYEYRQVGKDFELYDIEDDQLFEEVSQEFTIINDNQLFD